MEVVKFQQAQLISSDLDMRDRRPKGSDVGGVERESNLPISPGNPAETPIEPKQHERMVARDENRLFEVSSNLGMSFPDCIRNRYNEDKFFAPILANPEEFTNFAVRDRLIFFESEGMETVAVPDVRVREVLFQQDHSILAHLGDEKMATCSPKFSVHGLCYRLLRRSSVFGQSAIPFLGKSQYPNFSIIPP